jgi:hypothetical protein
MKYFFPHLLFGHKKVYVEEIKKASLERLASCARSLQALHGLGNGF